MTDVSPYTADQLAAVDPELVDILAGLPPRTFSIEHLPELRAQPPAIFTAPEQHNVDEHVERIPGSSGASPISLFVYRPRGVRTVMGCILHIHGGGFVAGSAGALAPLHRRLCEQLSCVIVSVDYRLAPETSFPGPLEDCYDALLWVHRHASSLNIDQRRVGVMGESAGGGLAAGLSLLARERNDVPVAFQHLVYPCLDDRTATLERVPHELVISLDNARFCWRSYLGAEPGGDDTSPFAAPARAANLEGLPPTFLASPELDLLAREHIRFAGALLAARVPLEFHLYRGAFHGFDRHPTARVAVSARNDALRFLAGCLAA